MKLRIKILFSVDGFRCGVGTTKINDQSVTGSYLNIFPQIKFNCDGYLTKMVYQALRPRDFYLGFWESVSDDTGFSLISKTKITANSTGIQVGL